MRGDSLFRHHLEFVNPSVILCPCRVSGEHWQDATNHLRRLIGTVPLVPVACVNTLHVHLPVIDPVRKGFPQQSLDLGITTNCDNLSLYNILMKVIYLWHFSMRKIFRTREKLMSVS